MNVPIGGGPWRFPVRSEEIECNDRRQLRAESPHGSRSPCILGELNRKQKMGRNNRDSKGSEQGDLNVKGKV